MSAKILSGLKKFEPGGSFVVVEIPPPRASTLGVCGVV